MFGKPRLMPLDESLDCPTWVGVKDCHYHSDRYNIDIDIPKGTVSDLASVPRWPGAYEIAGGQANSASYVHDFMYRTKCVTKEMADKIFYDCMVETRVQLWRAKLMYDAVCMFGDSSYGKKLAIRLPDTAY